MSVVKTLHLWCFDVSFKIFMYTTIRWYLIEFNKDYKVRHLFVMYRQSSRTVRGLCPRSSVSICRRCHAILCWAFNPYDVIFIQGSILFDSGSTAEQIVTTPENTFEKTFHFIASYLNWFRGFQLQNQLRECSS